MQNPPVETLVSATDVRSELGGISNSTLWRWLTEDESFPKPAAKHRRRNYWRRKDIEEFKAGLCR